ncbi:MAG: hypothetical protein COC22_00405 [Flavobacteriaceae bacterium]|nr:MAG: hypothetical protein COC22_00405 [Flavobacteriaceae bacterium]
MNVTALLKDVLNRCHSLIADKQEVVFMKHNQRVWGKSSHSRHDGEILLELNTAQSAIISYSYLANVLAEKHKANIVAYSTAYTPQGNGLVGALVKVSRAISTRVVKKIYASFGVTTFISVNLDKQQIDRAAKLFNEMHPSLVSKRDVENLIVEGIWIGDLIYDTFLRRYSLPTIDLKSEKFACFMRESFELLIYWQDYFKAHNVKAVNVSHCVYNNAIPLRIAAKYEIAAYQTNATHVYKMDANDIFAYGDYKYFPAIFAGLSEQQQAAGIAEAKRRIELRFSGEVGVDMSYSTKSAYGIKKAKSVLQLSDRKKILIAAHCFFDSPHSYGNNLFPDFYEWFDFLGKISNETDYDWYIKTHPDFLSGNTEIIDYFISKYPRFTLVDSSTSHHQLIEEGISCALTTYGTIGFEYAALGVLVVNASDCNPHIAYNFNRHPKTVEEYEYIVRNLDTQSLKINEPEVYEYYYMKFIYNSENWLFDDYEKMIEELGGYDGQFTSKVYDIWLSEWTKERHFDVSETMRQFIDSGDFRLNHSHMGGTE